MSKTNIKKLKYPAWFNIVFSILTLGVPLALFAYTGFTSADTTGGTIFKITFTGVLTLVLAWWFIYRFVIKKHVDKLLATQANLEHDYSIEVGNPDAIKTMWYNNEKILTLIDIIRVLLYGGLGVVLAIGIEAGVVKVKTTLFIIAICYVIAYTIKGMLLLNRKEDTDESEGNGKEVSEDNSTETNS